MFDEQMDFNDTVTEATASQAGGEDSQVNPIFHVSLDMIRKCTQLDGKMVLHRQVPAKVAIVGLITEPPLIQQSHDTLQIDDLSEGSPMAVHIYKGASEGVSPVVQTDEELVENMYIRIIGQPKRDVEHGTYVLAFNITTIKEYAEILNHSLSVIKDSLVLERRKEATENNEEEMEEGAAVTTSVKVGGMDSSFNSSFSMNMGMTATQQRVLNFIRKYPEASGCPKDVISAELRIPKQTVDADVDFLSNEGHIFTTVDDTTYKATDA